MTTTTRRVSATSVLLWLRSDLPREEARGYWAGPHGRLVARTPGFLEYRQHHFTGETPGIWPQIDGIETTIPQERRIDGMPEVTFEHTWSPLLGGKQAKKVRQDERNVFARTILHITGPGGGRWFKSGYGEGVDARFVVLLRRRAGVGRRQWKAFVHDMLGSALDRADGAVELRTQTFLPFGRRMWDTPDVAHDYPAREQFHGSLVLGAADHEGLTRMIEAVSERLAPELRRQCSAIHGYAVEQTYNHRREGGPT